MGKERLRSDPYQSRPFDSWPPDTLDQWLHEFEWFADSGLLLSQAMNNPRLAAMRHLRHAFCLVKECLSRCDELVSRFDGQLTRALVTYDPNARFQDALVISWHGTLTRYIDRLYESALVQIGLTSGELDDWVPIEREHRFLRALADRPPDQRIDFLTVRVKHILLLLERVRQEALVAFPDRRIPQTEVAGKGLRTSYLGLLVDEVHGTVTRIGDHLPVTFKIGSAQWHTFLVAFRAGATGASEEVWRNGYPEQWENRKNVKSEVNSKLKVLGVEFKKGTLKLIDSKRKSS